MKKIKIYTKYCYKENKKENKKKIYKEKKLKYNAKVNLNLIVNFFPVGCHLKVF